MTRKWYSDTEAKVTYAQFREVLRPFLAKMMPNYELSHIGFSRNNDTEEITIVLHLNQIGRVRVIGDDQLLLPAARIE